MNLSLKYDSLFLEGLFKGELWYCNTGLYGGKDIYAVFEAYNVNGKLLYCRKFSAPEIGLLDVICFDVEDIGPVYLKVMIHDRDSCIFKDYYAFINKQSDLRMLLDLRKPEALQIKEFLRDKDKTYIVLENTSSDIQFNIGLKSIKGTILDNYFTFMPGESIVYTTEGITDVHMLSVF